MPAHVRTQSTARAPRHQGVSKPSTGRRSLVASQPTDVHLSRWSLPILSSASSMTTEFPRMTCRQGTVSPDSLREPITTERNIPPCRAELSHHRPSPPRHRPEQCSRIPGRGVSTWMYADTRDVSGTYIVAAQDTNNLAASVQLDKQALVEVLGKCRSVLNSHGLLAGERSHTFFSSG